MHLPLYWYFLLCAASFVAGAINAVAGGGTLLTFPSLLAAGISPVVANATNTISLVPASIAGAFSFRKEMPGMSKHLKLFALPALIGSAFGAWLMLVLGDKVLAALVPWLILFAAVLFLLQESLSKAINKNHKSGEDGELSNIPVMFIFVLLVGIYGGYFGAGMGIMTLATMGLLGMTNIHKMNGLKNILAAAINVVATIAFIFAGKIDWLIAVLMASAATLGGFSGAGLALKLGPKRVRQLIVVLGFSIAGYMFWQRLRG